MKKENKEESKKDPNLRQKSNKTCIMVFENDKGFVYKCFENFYTFDTVLRKWVKDREEVSYESLSEHGLQKGPLEISAIFIRERESRAWSSVEFDFFLAKFRFQIPNVHGFEHAYISYEEETHTVHAHVLTSKWSYVIDFNDKTLCRMLGEPEPITREQAKELMKEGKVYPHFLQGCPHCKAEGSLFTQNIYRTRDGFRCGLCYGLIEWSGNIWIKGRD